MALEIKDSNFDELLNAGKPMVVDFWATWCGPCKKIAPDVEALAEQYKEQVVVGKCDVDDNDELTGRFGVRNIPTVLFIKDGKVQDKTVGAVTKAELEEKYGKDSYVEVTSAQEGLVSFVSDGQENLKQSQVSEETFLSKAKMSDLRTNKKQKAGSPVYRFIKGQDWQLMVPVGQNGYNRLKKRAEDNSSIQVTFQKDNFTTTTSYRCLKQNGKYYVILSFDNYIQRYLNQRYLSVSLTLSETNGLKIPSSSLVKKSVYRIPKSFLVHGGNSAEKDQLNIMETNKKGEKVLRQTSAIVYKTNDKYAYVVSKDLKTGIIISETDKQKIYTIKDSDKVEILGVYMVNKGYAVFALVDMVERNGDYCIVSTSGSKIELYDRIILNSDTVKEGQVIY